MKVFDKEKREVLKKALNYDFKKSDTMEVFDCDKEFETLEELHTSKEYASIFGKSYSNVMSDQIHFDNKHSKEFKFISAYVIGDEIYKHYKADGLEFFSKISLHSCISNRPFDDVVISFEGIILKYVRNWENSTANRILLRKMETILTVDL